MKKYLLEIKKLSKQYGLRLIVNNISMKIYNGEIVGLLGPNGAGKTTLFYMIIGLISSTSGKVYINNEDITKMSICLRARKGLSYLPQESSIFRKLSVEDNIIAILETRKNLNRNIIKKKLNDLLDEFNIKYIRKSLGINLSGGERRRVEIARTLAIDPKFILLDEPFANVDPVSIIEIKKIIYHLKNRGIGILITDHNVRETLNICEKAYIINNGNMLEQGVPKKILSNEEVKKVYLGKDFKL